jgi:hypothetical protein
MMEAIHSTETSVHTRPSRRHIPEDGILHSHRRENLKSYKNPRRVLCLLIIERRLLSTRALFSVLNP